MKLHYLVVLTPRLSKEMQKNEKNISKIKKNYLNFDFEEEATLSIEEIKKDNKSNNNLTFWKTIQIGQIENSDQISSIEYLYFLQNDANPKLHTINKIRYQFEYMGQIFYLDVYPFSKVYGILTIVKNEINFDNENLKIDFPEYIQLVHFLEQFSEREIANCLSFNLKN